MEESTTQSSMNEIIAWITGTIYFFPRNHAQFYFTFTA